MPQGSIGTRRYKGTRIEIQGVPEVKKIIEELGATHGKSVERNLAKQALRAMLKPVAAAIKRDAPKLSRSRLTGQRQKRLAKVGTIRKAVGSRLSRNKRRNIHEARAGLNVAKSRGKHFRQAHLYTLGSKRRTTRKGLNRGQMGGDDFVIKARERSQAAASQAGLYAVHKALPGEIEKVRKRHEKRATLAAAAGAQT